MFLSYKKVRTTVTKTSCYFRIVDSDESEEEKPKAKTKSKKSIDEDVKEVTKNLKNVSVINKSQKKKADVTSEGESYPKSNINVINAKLGNLFLILFFDPNKMLYYYLAIILPILCKWYYANNLSNFRVLSKLAVNFSLIWFW